MRFRRRLHGGTLAVLVAGGALLAGCGGGGGDSTVAVSNSQFRAKVTAICRHGADQIEAAAQKYMGAGGPTPGNLERFAAAAVVPDTEAAINRLEKLTPPQGIAASYAALVNEMRSTNKRLKADPGLLAGHGDPFAKANKLAKRAGLDACAAE